MFFSSSSISQTAYFLSRLKDVAARIFLIPYATAGIQTYVISIFTSKRDLNEEPSVLGGSIGPGYKALQFQTV